MSNSAKVVERDVNAVFADPRVVERLIGFEHGIGVCYRCNGPMTGVASEVKRWWILPNRRVRRIACGTCKTIEESA